MARTVLKWRVDVDYHGGQYWEPIAAFNCEPVALGYAKDCVATQRACEFLFRYRVVTTRNRVIWESS